MNSIRRIIWDLQHKHVFDELSDVQAGKLIKMVLNHCAGEEVTMESPVLWMAYKAITDRIDWFNPQISLLEDSDLERVVEKQRKERIKDILENRKFREEYLKDFLGDLNITLTEGE